MAVVFEATYSKKLGLPGFSSHEYSICIRSELSEISQVDAESKRIHGLIQSSVDREIQQTGFLPEIDPTGHNRVSNGNGNGNGYNGNGNGNGNGLPQNGNGNGNGYHQNGNGAYRARSNGYGNGAARNGNGDQWSCSPKQKDLLLNVVSENNLGMEQVEQLAQDRFGKSVQTVNKLEASGLIEELFCLVGQNKNGRQFQKAGRR